MNHAKTSNYWSGRYCFLQDINVSVPKDVKRTEMSIDSVLAISARFGELGKDE